MAKIFLKTKGDYFSKLKNFKAFIENQTRKNMKVVRTNNDGKFVPREFQQFLKEHGIHHQTFAPYTQLHNSVVERLNCTIVESAQCMLHQQNLKPRFWVKVVNIVVYLKVKSPHITIDRMTLEKKYNERRPEV